MINLKRYDSLIIKLMYSHIDKKHMTHARRKYCLTKNKQEKYSNIYFYFKNRFNDITTPNNPINEVIYRLVSNINNAPRCPICGNLIIFSGGIYHNYCSQKCCKNDDHLKQRISNTKKNISEDKKQEILKKYEQTCIEKYGVKHYVNKEKREQTCIEKYGVKHYTSTKEWKQHYIEWWNSLSDEEKQERLAPMQFGNKKYFSSEENKDKHSKKLLKYNKNLRKDINAYTTRCENTKNAMARIPNEQKIQQYIKKANTCANWSPEYITEINNKRYKTREKNNTFLGPRSIIEDETYNIIKQHFTDAIHRYHDIRYADENGKMFECDIYIPSKDAFIECQYYYTHHPVKGKFSGFDINNENDYQFYLKNLEDKRQWRVYVITDPLKRHIAKINNLNFFEIWKYNIDEINEIINKINKLPNI